MIQTVEAIVDELGTVRLLEPLILGRRHRAFVTILDDGLLTPHESALLRGYCLAPLQQAR